MDESGGRRESVPVVGDGYRQDEVCALVEVEDRGGPHGALLGESFIVQQGVSVAIQNGRCQGVIHVFHGELDGDDLRLVEIVRGDEGERFVPAEIFIGRVVPAGLSQRGFRIRQRSTQGGFIEGQEAGRITV